MNGTIGKNRKMLRSLVVWVLVIGLVMEAFTTIGMAATSSVGTNQAATETAATKASTLTKTATGKANRRLGVVMREKATSSSKKVTRIPNNAKITLCSVTFVTKTKYARKKRWFYVKYKNYTGYVPVTQVDTVRYNYVTGTAKNALVYRKGAGTKMKKAGVLKKGTKLKLCLLSYAKDSKTLWYRFRKGSKFYFVSSTDLVTSSASSSNTSSGTSSSTASGSSSSSSTSSSTSASSSSTTKDSTTSTATAAKATSSSASSTSSKSSVNATVLQDNSKPIQMTMPSTTLTAWYNALLKMADQIEDNDLKYNTSGGGNTYAKGLKNKKVNCATYISWSMQQAGFEDTGFCFYLGNAKIYNQYIPKNYFINSPEYLVQTGLNMTIKDAVSKGYLKPGDIVGKQSGYHTMVYKHTKNGKYYFFSVGPTSVANETIRENTYSASYKIGVIIRRVA